MQRSHDVDVQGCINTVPSTFLGHLSFFYNVKSSTLKELRCENMCESLAFSFKTPKIEFYYRMDSAGPSLARDNIPVRETGRDGSGGSERAMRWVRI